MSILRLRSLMPRAAARKRRVLRGVIGHLAAAVRHRAPRARHLARCPPGNGGWWCTSHPTKPFRHTVIICHAFAGTRWLKDGAVERCYRWFRPARWRLHLVDGEALQVPTITTSHRNVRTSAQMMWLAAEPRGPRMEVPPDTRYGIHGFPSVSSS